jgi:hypothetical protein
MRSTVPPPHRGAIIMVAVLVIFTTLGLRRFKRCERAPAVGL